jgi:hypothetical protein
MLVSSAGTISELRIDETHFGELLNTLSIPGERWNGFVWPLEEGILFRKWEFILDIASREAKNVTVKLPELSFTMTQSMVFYWHLKISTMFQSPSISLRSEWWNEVRERTLPRQQDINSNNFWIPALSKDKVITHTVCDTLISLCCPNTPKRQPGTRPAFKVLKKRKAWLDHRVCQGHLCAYALRLLSRRKGGRHVSTNRRTRRALHHLPLVLYWLLLLLWRNSESNAKTVSLWHPIQICAESRTHASTNADARTTSETKRRGSSRTIPPRAHILCCRNARGDGVSEYILEPESITVDAIVERVTDLVPVVEFKGVNLAEELVERSSAQ